MIGDKSLATQVPPKEGHSTEGRAPASPHIDFDHLRQQTTSPGRPELEKPRYLEACLRDVEWSARKIFGSPLLAIPGGCNDRFRPRFPGMILP